MKKSNVYTLTGDKGTTSLVGGKRVKKTDIRLETYGTVDELNSYIGFLAAYPEISQEVNEFLHSIQNKLFNVGAYLATDNSDGSTNPIAGLGEKNIATLEAQIDDIDAKLPPLCRFVLPGGCQAASAANVCRAVTRRCERRVIALAETTYVDPIVIKYLNRLSDYFFVLSRFINNNNQIEEIFWDKD